MKDDETAQRGSNNRTDLKHAVVPGYGVGKRIAGNQRWKKRAPRRPRECSRNGTEEKQEINQRNRSVIEMERLVVFLENCSDRAQATIARAQDRQLRDGEMLPGDEREQCRRDRAEDLRNKNDMFAADPVG